MAKLLDSLVSFNGGELSPRIDARVDQQRYRSGLRQCQNMIPLKQGPITRRPGTQYIAKAKLTNIPGFNFAARLMKFIFSPTTTFVLEFGNKYVRFYSNGRQVNVNSAPVWVSGTPYVVGNFVEDPGAGNAIYYCIAATSGTTQPHLDAVHWVAQTIYEIPSPYNANAGTNPVWSTDVWQIVPCQINDVVYLVHPSYPPYRLTRISNTNWTLVQVNFISPPLLDQNATDVTIAPSAVTGTGITLTATAPAWVTATYYQIGNSVLQGGLIYNCIVAHTSGTFATDLAAGDWQQVNIFNALHIGSTWQLADLQGSTYLEVDGTAAAGFTNGTSSTIKALGAWDVHTYGVWSSDIAVQRSLDNGVTWDTIRTITSRSDRNVDISGVAVQLGLYRFNITNSAALVNPGATNPRVVFEVADSFLYGLVKITAVANAYSATADVITALASTAATEYWSEAAWSDYRGYPQAVTAYQQRVIYASSGYEPQRIWGTVTNDIENFALGDQTLATDAFAFDLNAPGRGPIQWLIAQLDLFAGFSGAEWVITSGSTNTNGQSSGAAITATNVNAVEHSAWGSAAGVQPYNVGDAVMFCERQATSLRQMLFSVYTQKYMSQEMTSLANHLFSSGIVQIDYQPQFKGQGVIWCVTQQGTLCGMTYEMQEEVYGWHRHVTGGGDTNARNPGVADNGFESVAVIDGTGVNDDEVWVVVSRNVGVGSFVRYIERINPNNWETTFTGAPNPPAPVISNAFYVDAGITVNAPGSPTVSGLTHLIGRYVVGLADGQAFGPLAVSGGGTVVIPNQPDTGPLVVQVGLAIDYACQPMRIDMDSRAGNTQGLVKTISDLYLRVMNSCGGEVSNGGTTAQPVPLNYVSTANPLAGPVMVTAPTDMRIQPQPNPDLGNDPVFIVQGSDALPLTVLALICKYDATGTP